MYHISTIKKLNQNTAHSEKARLQTSYAVQGGNKVILRHDGRVKYLEEATDVSEFLAEIKGKKEDQIRSVIRSRYTNPIAH
jgi:hypothetical protein